MAAAAGESVFGAAETSSQRDLAGGVAARADSTMASGCEQRGQATCLPLHSTGALNRAPQPQVTAIFAGAGAVASGGTSIACPHLVQATRLPANAALALNRCPHRQVTSIAIDVASEHTHVDSANAQCTERTVRRLALPWRKSPTCGLICEQEFGGASR